MAKTGLATPGPPRITKALISSASRPTTLDSRHRPKSLIDIEGTTLISHVLRQLYRGGIQHIIFVVSHNGDAIQEELQVCVQNLRQLRLEVIDLSQNYQGFYAASLLAAGEHCFADEDKSGGVLIATADHIYDQGLVTDMCNAELRPGCTDVCVLVDFSRQQWVGLPATTVGVRCTDDLLRVCELSRALGEPMVKGEARGPCVGVEAGLFACTRSIFERLSQLAKDNEYFTITDAIQELAKAGLVSSLPTRGRNWLAIETITELEETRSNCNAVLGASSEASPSSFALKDPLPAIFVAGGPVIA